MTRRIVARVLPVVALAALVACSDLPLLEVDDTTPPWLDGSDSALDPPRLHVQGGQTADVGWHSFCLETTCVDGVPPEPLPDAGASEALQVVLARPGWTLGVRLEPVRDDCARHLVMEPTDLTDGSATIPAAGPAGDYRVHVTAHPPQPERGSVDYTFRWTTTVHRPSTIAPRSARIHAVYEDDGQVLGHGGELLVVGLDPLPDVATATASVSAGGTAVALELDGGVPPCNPSGLLFWQIDEIPPAAIDRLGGPPFTYTVTLDLDGTVHTGTATYPTDLVDGLWPEVALTFDPPIGP